MTTPPSIERLHHGFVWRGRIGFLSPRAVALFIGIPTAIGAAIGLTIGALQGDPFAYVALTTAITGGTPLLLSTISALYFGLKSRSEIVFDISRGRVLLGSHPISKIGDFSVSRSKGKLALEFGAGVRYVLHGDPEDLDWVQRHMYAYPLDDDAYAALRGTECPEGITPTHHGWTATVGVKSDDAYIRRTLRVDLAEGVLELGGGDHPMEGLVCELRGARTLRIVFDESRFADLQMPTHEAAAWMTQNLRRHEPEATPVPSALSQMRSRRDTQTE